MRAVDRTGGFTLLEIVVALTIAGLALVGLFRAGSGGVLAVDAAGRYSEAVQRAHSHLAAIGRLAVVAPGDSEGEDGGAYRWRVRILPLAAWPLGPPETAARITLYDVRVEISWPAGGRRRAVVLNSLRLG
jgi:prepilin-type N-terminal cleavage/methylation domain-containing protein